MHLEIIILAAGAGRRFRAGDTNLPKQLAQIGGETLLARAIRTAKAISFAHISLVLGFESESLRNQASDARVIINPHRDSGLGNSIAIAVKNLPAETDAVLLLLADQVAVESADLQKLVDTFSANKLSGQPMIACAAYDFSVGVPAIFSKEYFAELASLSGDQGAKKLIQKYFHRAVPMPSASVDIDTQSDLENYLKKNFDKPFNQF